MKKSKIFIVYNPKKLEIDEVIPKNRFILLSQKYESYYIVILIQNAVNNSIIKRTIFERYDPELFSFWEDVIEQQDYKRPSEVESIPVNLEKFVCTRFVCNIGQTRSSLGYDTEETTTYNELDNIL